MKKIGFIGLGEIGTPMAMNLMKAGYTLTVYDRQQSQMQDLVDKGAVAGTSCKTVAEQSEIVITVLPNSPHVEKAILHKDGVLEGAKEGAIIIDMSSIDPLVSKRIAKEVEKKGVKMLDAPVRGKRDKAEAGTLSISVGGHEEVFEEVRDILTLLGSSVLWVGDIGSGNMTKIVDEILIAINMASVSEAMLLAKKFGANPKLIRKSIRGGLAGSAILDRRLEAMTDKVFETGYHMNNHLQDLDNAMDIGKELDMPLPLTGNVLEMMRSLKAHGYGDMDNTVLVKYYEMITGNEL